MVLKPRRHEDAGKIERSLSNGKKVRAKVKVLLKDAAGNTYFKKLTIRLKPKR